MDVVDAGGSVALLTITAASNVAVKVGCFVARRRQRLGLTTIVCLL